jgi:hypothetical protein
MDAGAYCMTAFFIFLGVWFVANIIIRIIRHNKK